MKTNYINIKRISLMILVLLSVLFTSNTLQAQTDEEEDEDGGGFFSDGLNDSRFESSFGNTKENARPTYEYKNRSNDRTTDGPVNYQTKELDIEVDRHQNFGGGVQVIGGGGGSVGNPASPNGISSGINGATGSVGITPPLKRTDPIHSFPDNPDDPDVPIDGGVGFLIAAGLGFGLKKLKNRRK